MKHIWSVFCQQYIINRDSNNPSLIEILDQINFQGELPDKRPLELPLSPIIYFVSDWKRDSESDRKKYEALVNVISPDSLHIGNFPILVDLEQSSSQCTVGKMDRIVYTVNGVYAFQVYIKENDEWKPVASIPLEIIHTEPDKEQKSESL